ncbi:UNVERIFIED_CONTAM: hypothetical protein FKN15_069284 [Acipenser sinensis]
MQGLTRRLLHQSNTGFSPQFRMQSPFYIKELDCGYQQDTGPWKTILAGVHSRIPGACPVGAASLLVEPPVVDVYQQWCGPCRAVVSLFRKIKNELGDDLLHFAMAETDGTDSLERYRGKCEPTFLFYGNKGLILIFELENRCRAG